MVSVKRACILQIATWWVWLSSWNFISLYLHTPTFDPYDHRVKITCQCNIAWWYKYHEGFHLWAVIGLWQCSKGFFYMHFLHGLCHCTLPTWRIFQDDFSRIKAACTTIISSKPKCCIICTEVRHFEHVLYQCGMDTAYGFPATYCQINTKGKAGAQ